MHLLLLPFTWIYSIIISIRNFLFDIRFFSVKRFNIPIINVGNISLGGTGKTPQIDYIITLLKEENKVAILSRGYARMTSCFLYVKVSNIAQEVGDEPLQLKKKHPDCIIAVDKNRRKGISKLLKDHPDIDVILLDDAFQHRWVLAGLNILLTSYQKPIYKDYLLPSGTLREHKKSIKRADIIVVTKCPKNLNPNELRLIHQKLNLYPYQQLFFSYIQYNNWRNLFGNSNIDNLKEYEIILVTGIANGKILKNELLEKGFKLSHIEFSDHHHYSNEDVKKILSVFKSNLSTKKVILTTEKDSCKLAELKNRFDDAPVFVVPIETNFTKQKEFNERIKNYITEHRKNKSISAKEN